MAGHRIGDERRQWRVNRLASEKTEITFDHTERSIQGGGVPRYFSETVDFWVNIRDPRITTAGAPVGKLALTHHVPDGWSDRWETRQGTYDLHAVEPGRAVARLENTPVVQRAGSTGGATQSQATFELFGETLVDPLSGDHSFEFSLNRAENTPHFT